MTSVIMPFNNTYCHTVFVWTELHSVSFRSVMMVLVLNQSFEMFFMFFSYIFEYFFFLSIEFLLTAMCQQLNDIHHLNNDNKLKYTSAFPTIILHYILWACYFLKKLINSV